MAVVYTRTLLKARIAPMISGVVADTDINTLLNKSVTDVLSDVDCRSTKRRSALTPNLFDDVYQYTCPTDLKDVKIVDVKPQTGRGRFDDWVLTTPEEFDRMKKDLRTDAYGEPIEIDYKEDYLGQGLISIDDYNTIRKLLVSYPVDDSSVTIDALNAVGDWEAFGDAENVEADTANYVAGSGAIKFDITSAGGTTCGIYNDDVSTFDVTDYKSEGSIFVWAYIVSATNLTNFIIRVGSSSSAYYYITITTDNEGSAFSAGWNLLRFDFADKATTGTPDDDACDYVALYMTKDAAKVSEVGYRFDNIVMRKGSHYNVYYYSKYWWQSSTGTFLENSTADTDYINLEADEVNLIEAKYMENAERYLRNFSLAKINKGEYDSLVATYQAKHPSEALPLQSTYYFTS